MAKKYFYVVRFIFRMKTDLFYMHFVCSNINWIKIWKYWQLNCQKNELYIAGNVHKDQHITMTCLILQKQKYIIKSLSQYFPRKNLNISNMQTFESQWTIMNARVWQSIIITMEMIFTKPIHNCKAKVTKSSYKTNEFKNAINSMT